MKLTFLGSSHGVPSECRFCSSAMLEVGDRLYLIDAGAPVIDLLLRAGKRPEQLRAVFTTHAHGDHVGGLPYLLDLCNWYFDHSDMDVYLTEKALVENVTDYVSLVEGRPFCHDRLRLHLADGGTVFDDGTVRVLYVPTSHFPPRPSYALVIEAENRRLLFTGDLSAGLERHDFPAVAAEKDFDLVACEMAHIGPRDVLPVMASCRTKSFWFQHVYPFDKFDAIDAMNGSFSYPVYTAHDGDTVEW